MNLKLRELFDNIMDSRNRLEIDNLDEHYRGEFLIYEGLTHSVDVKQSVKSLNISGFKSYAENDKFNVWVDSTTNFNKLNSLIDNVGYFPAYLYAIKSDGEIKNKYSTTELQNYISNYKKVRILYEPKYDQEVEKLPRFLYHLTTKMRADKIMKQGLSPKTNSKASAHPERVYLAYNVDDLLKLSNKLAFLAHIHKNDYPVILKIDTERIPDYFRIFGAIPYKNRKMKDPNYVDKGIFTLNTIPPSAITIELDMNPSFQ